jgi:hypothetical protein
VTLRALSGFINLSATFVTLRALSGFINLSATFVSLRALSGFINLSATFVSLRALSGFLNLRALSGFLFAYGKFYPTFHPPPPHSEAQIPMFGIKPTIFT